MASRRMIGKRISISEQVNDLSIKAALIFTWMITHADDFGIMTGSPRKIKALVVPMRDDISAADVESALEEMTQAELIYWYEYEGTMYVQFPKWDEHQSGLHKRTKSKFPSYQDAINARGVAAAREVISEPVEDNPNEKTQNNMQKANNAIPFPVSSRTFPEVPGHSRSTEQNLTELNRTEKNIYSSQPSIVTTKQNKKEKSVRPNKKPVYDRESVEFSLAEKLRTGVLSNLPSAKVPDLSVKKMRNWCHDMNLVLRVDKRPPDEVERVIDFALSDSFWMSNILSPGKLRKQYDTLLLQMMQRQKRKGGCVKYDKRDEASGGYDDIAEFMVT